MEDRTRTLRGHFPGPGSWGSVSDGAIRTLFFNKTTSDYAGQEPDIRTSSFKSVRESQRPSAEARRHRRRAAPRLDALWGAASGREADVGGPELSAVSPLSQPLKKKLALTAYEQEYVEKPLEGFGIDTEFARSMAAQNQGTRAAKHAPTRGTYISCYGHLCVDRTKSGPDFNPRPVFERAGDNGLRGLISPSASSTRTPPSFASTQHGPQPMDLLAPPEPYLPREEIGRVPKSSDFFNSSHRREFSAAAAGARSPAAALRRTASAPGGQLARLAAEVGPERVFREQMMQTRYGLTHGAVPPVTAPGGGGGKRPR